MKVAGVNSMTKIGSNNFLAASGFGEPLLSVRLGNGTNTDASYLFVLMLDPAHGWQLRNSHR